MHDLIFIVALLCPALLTPLVLPIVRWRMSRRTYRRLAGSGGSLPNGLSVEPTLVGARKRSHLWCGVKRTSPRYGWTCGGRIHQVRETVEFDVGGAFLCSSIARVCLVCGTLEKTGHRSRILGPAFAGVTDAASLGAAIRTCGSAS